MPRTDRTETNGTTNGTDSTRGTKPAPATPAPPVTGEELRSVLAELIGVSPAEIEDDANLIRLGLGSLEMMRLVTKWRRAGLGVDFGELTSTPTFAAWNDRITQELTEKTG
ncbi:Aryl carrier domain-containing protein [Streptomyces sp. yr375]|uniref:phosphopantetheine-binding protein n=1 Tax=Streptomyces sp. yr375 TaxID=1761906 RepID=UPI0008BB84C3|nr:phosphopantetheine-binding protein [Streptomyces sp. yr375]SES10619.1 Aryl carrier domain-containing protein [Streptomyces sp. yr375]